MQHIVILGNSGAARECYQLLQDCLWASNTLRANTHFKGFLSFDHYDGNLQSLQAHFLGDFSEYHIDLADRFIIGIGSPHLRASAFAALKSRDAKLINLISPWAYIPPDVIMGEGNIFGTATTLTADISIGDGNFFNGHVTIGHDVSIGNFNFFAQNTMVMGAATVGNRNFMAVQSTLLDHAKIGDDNKITPGAIVFKGCKNNCRLAGNPALIIHKG